MFSSGLLSPLVQITAVRPDHSTLVDRSSPHLELGGRWPIAERCLAELNMCDTSTADAVMRVRCQNLNKKTEQKTKEDSDIKLELVVDA